MPQSFRSILKELDVFVILGALLLVAAIFKASTFYNLSNLFTVLELSAVLGIATLGEAMVLIVRGVDVSVVAVMGFAGTLSAFLIPNFGLAVAILVPLVACGLIGLGNGLLVEKGRVPPIVATIGMMWVVSGLAGGISNGRLIPIEDQAFQRIALGSAFEIIPLFFVGLLIIGAIAYFVRSNFAIAATSTPSGATRARLTIPRFPSPRSESASMARPAFSTA